MTTREKLVRESWDLTPAQLLEEKSDFLTHPFPYPAVQYRRAAILAMQEGEEWREKADKFMWQVRDTCTRAENAERARDELKARLVVDRAAVDRFLASYYDRDTRATGDAEFKRVSKALQAALTPPEPVIELIAIHGQLELGHDGICRVQNGEVVLPNGEKLHYGSGTKVAFDAWIDNRLAAIRSGEKETNHNGT